MKKPKKPAKLVKNRLRQAAKSIKKHPFFNLLIYFFIKKIIINELLMNY